MSKLEFNHLTLSQGYQLGDYVIQDLLGQGGFGIAYLAQDIHLQNRVVIKEYFPSELASRDGQTVTALGTNGQIDYEKGDYEKGMAFFLDEAIFLARFNHPAVVQILKCFKQNNTAYMVMEFIDGETLDSYLRRKKRLSPQVAERFAVELLSCLEVLHQSDLIHRDIKPSSIMLRPGGFPVLISLGVARDAIEKLNQDPERLLIYDQYFPIECFASKGVFTFATNLYSVGVILYKCLTGITPDFSYCRIINDEHIPVSRLSISEQCSPGLVRLIDQCMQIRQQDRPQSVQDAKYLMVETKDTGLCKDVRLGRRGCSDSEAIERGYNTHDCAIRRLIIKETISAFEATEPGWYHQLAKQNLSRWRKEATMVSGRLQVEVHAGDWGDITMYLTKKYGHCFAVLNMANPFIPGGAYIEGGMAQEENMFRRTDCHFSVSAEIYDYKKDRYKTAMTELITARHGHVYIDVTNPRVCIRSAEDRAREDLGYALLPEHDVFPFIELRAAAQDLRDGSAFNSDAARTRIIAQLDTLREHNIRYAVLGAFGCGAFKNPASQVATIYREELAKRADEFDVVAFAIFDAGYGPDNHKPFADVFRHFA